MENFVVIDLGSNSVRMTVTKINEDGTHEHVMQMKEFVRLSENMGPEKELKSAAIDRTLKALHSFKDVYDKLDNVHIKAVATAAVRQATNQKAFLKKVKSEFDIDLEVISGTQEAYYDYIGVTETLSVTNAVLIDTGGASIEIVLVQNGKVQNLISIPIGSVTISSDFDFSNKVAASELFKAVVAMNDIFQDIWWLKNGMNLPIIGLGGSNRTLAKINRRRDQLFNMEDIHGYKIDRKRANDTFKDIIGLDYEGRREVPGISKDRADIIVGGLIPIVLMMNALDSEKITFSTSGLRVGILYEHLHDVQRAAIEDKENK